MGIENTARDLIITCNPSVTNLPERRARFSCEKHRHTSQRQPMRPLETNTDGAAPTEQVVLYNPMLPMANGAVGLAEIMTVRVEYLDTRILSIAEVYEIILVDHHRMGEHELARTGTVRAPCLDEIAIAIELDHA